MTQRALRKKLSDNSTAHVTSGNDPNGLIQYNPNLFSMNKFISLPEELKVKSHSVSLANSNGTHLPVKAGTPIYFNHTPVSTSYSSNDKGNNAHLNGTSVVIVKNDESTISNRPGNSKSGCVNECRPQLEKTYTSNGHIVGAFSSQNSSISSSNSEASLGHYYKRHSQSGSPISARKSVDLDLLFSSGDSHSIIGNKEEDKSVDYQHVGDNTEYTGSSLSSSPISTNQIFESSDPVHFNESTFGDNVVSHFNNRGDQFLLHHQEHLGFQQDNYTALRQQQLNHIDSNKTQSTMSSAYIYSTLPRASGYLVYSPSNESANMKQRSYSNGDTNHITKMYAESNLLRSKGKFKSLPSLSGSSVSLDKLQRKMEKKREKEEKKRIKEELKRREKEEKRLRKLLKKQGALHMNTLPRNWNYVERPIESVYYQGSNLKLRPVAIDYVDGPVQSPPAPVHQPPPPPSSHNTQIQDRLNTRTSAIYASAPDLLRIEQVYGTTNRRKSHAVDDRVIYSQPSVSVPRNVVLQKGHEGYGFVLRGAKSHSAAGNIDFQPTAEFPALQYLDSVDPGSQADRVGLKPGDFILEINGEKVVRATHERVVHLIKSSGARLSLIVVTVRSVDKSNDWFVHQDGSMTLPSRKKQAPAPPKRDPDTSLSYSKARAKSMAEGLAEIEKLDQTLLDYDDKSEYKVASIKARPTSKRNTIALEDVTVHATETNHLSPSELRIKKYHRKTSSQPPMERSKSTPDLVPPGETINSNEIIYDTPMVSDDKSKFSTVHVSLGHSRRDSENSVSPGSSNPHIYAAPSPYVASLGRNRKVGNVESVRHSVSIGTYPYNIVTDKDSSSRSGLTKIGTPPNSGNSTPVPRRPAPAPPKKVSAPELPVRGELNPQVVTIVTPNNSTYANVSAEIQKQKKDEETIYESSFRPGTLARLNNNPKDKSGVQQGAQTSEQTGDQKAKKSSVIATNGISQNMSKNQEQYYEPEPDYESDEDKKRKTTIKHQVLVHTDNTNRNKQQSATTTVQKQSQTTVSDKTNLVDPANSTSLRKPSITVISIGNNNNNTDTSQRRKSLSGEIVSQSTEEKAYLRHDNSAINNRRKSGSNLVEDRPLVNNYIIPPKPSQPAPAPPVSTTVENGHVSPPPTMPPPPPPLPPPLPFSQPSTYSQSSSTEKVQQSQSAPQVSLDDIRKAAALRQARIETEGLKITELADHSSTVKDSKELKKEQNQAALLAAIAKRRELLEKNEDHDIVDQIENKLQKTKKLQSAKLYFSSDGINKKNDSTVSKNSPVSKVEETKSNDKNNEPETFVIDKKETILPVKSNENVKQPDKTAILSNGQHTISSSGKPKNVSQSNAKPERKISSVSSDNKQNDQSNSDFLALAEKARQDWLQKKSQAPKASKAVNIEVTSVENMGKTSEINSVKSRLANFENNKSSESQFRTNGISTVNSDRKHSSIAPPPPGFDDHTVHIELVSSPASSYGNEINVNKPASGFSQDDNSSQVSSVSTLSTLSSENDNNHLDVIAPPPPGFDDSSDIRNGHIPSSEVNNKNGKPFNSKVLDTWSCVDVIDWLDDMHLSQYKKSFSQNCIDGKKLLKLNRDAFIELGVSQVGHRMNLERSIKKFMMKSG